MITFRLAGRLIWKSTLIWAAGLAVLVVSGVKAYTSLYATEASRQLLVSTLGATKALSALYGPPVRLDTAGGFLVWRYGTIIAIVSGVWALLTVTRLLRGDEDENRTDLLLAGPLDPIHLLLSQVAAFGVGALILGAALAVGSMTGGLPVEGSLRFGALGLVDALIFGSVAAVASQLADHRRAAAGWTGALLGGSYLVRAVADGSVGHGWMVWLSPLGWSEQLSPFGDPNLVAVGLVIATPAALLAITIGLRRRRDVGAGVWTRMSAPPASSPPMRTTLALDWRLTRGTLLAWAAGMAIFGGVVGFLASAIADYARQDESLRNLMNTFSQGAALTSVDGFIAYTFSFVAIILAVFAGSQIVVGRQEEGRGRLDGLLVTQVSRTRWLSSRIAIGFAATVVLAVVAALATWLGVAATGSSTSLGGVIAAALNVVPVALLFGGLSVLAFGVVPRLTAAVAFGSVAIAYLAQLVAAAPRWLIDASPFSHVAAVPTQPVDVAGLVVILALAVAFTVAGQLAFCRRDILT